MSDILFLILAVVCIGSSFAGQMLFPGAHGGARVGRALLDLFGLVVIAVGSERILFRRFKGKITLGLGPPVRSLIGFVAGVGGGVALVAMIAAGYWVFSPYHFEHGAASLGPVAADALDYLLNNAAEELVFRGYLLITLARRFGLNAALLIVAGAFGLFHLPGLSGLAAIKMVLTTAAFSYVFAGAFLASGTIWTAIGLHFASNMALHKGAGLDGGIALLRPVMDRGSASHYDPGFWICLIAPLAVAYPLLCRRFATGVWIGDDRE